MDQWPTAAKTGEFGLRAIFDNVRDGLVLVRLPGRQIVMFNRAASDMTGTPVRKALAGHLQDLFSDSIVASTVDVCSQQPVGVWPGHYQDNLKTRFRGGGPGEDVEVHFCRVDEVDSDGPLVLLVLRPAAESGLAAATRLRGLAQRRIEELEGEARTHALLFSEVAHEFNTPLTVVALQAHLLRASLGTIESAQERALGIIKSNVHRLVLLAQDLVDLARADAGRLLLKAVPFDAVPLVAQEVENLRELANRAGVQLRMTGTPPNALVRGESPRLRQVLANFVGNAIKYTPRGGHVDVAVNVAGDQLEVRIRDDGIGMGDEDLHRLFMPFVRVETPGADKKPGTGLGLYLSKRIIEAHGGEAGCSSPGVGKGMTFWFRVPVLAMPGMPPTQAGTRPARPSPRGDVRRRTHGSNPPAPATGTATPSPKDGVYPAPVTRNPPRRRAPDSSGKADEPT